MRAKLREIDDDVSAAVLAAFSEDQIDDFRREAAPPSSATAAGSTTRPSRTPVRFTLQRARETLGLPRVSLV